MESRAKRRASPSGPTEEAKGPGATKRARKTPTETLATTPADAEGTSAPLTALDIFGLCITRAENLIQIHAAAHGTRARPAPFLADAHRAAIVLAVSALDAFVRTFVIGRIRRLLADKTATLPDSLSDRIKRFLKEDGLLDAARKDDLLERVEKAFRSDFERKSFQGTKNISEIMKLVGHDDIFHEIASNAQCNEDRLKSDLDKYTSRRHVIAHRGDYDLTQRPPVEQQVLKKDAVACIKLVKTIAETIQDLP